jgi:hypothetical protein
MSYLIVKGSYQYIRKMYLHLKKEHPSTRGRMKAIQGNNLKHLRRV